MPLLARELRRLNPFAVEFRHDDESIPLLNRDVAADIVQQIFNSARSHVENAPNT